MSKAKIIDKKSVDSILGEKNILSQLHHPFIVNMVYSFQDHEYLYLVMDLLPGGNLRYHLSMRRRFNEKQNKFLICCILVGLEYIHGENILHRDIKPENLVFDSNGYLRITDFGIAKKYVVNNKKDTSGTVGYLAPEVLCNENHTFSIDYYAIGIITYELAYGHRPYIGKTKHEVKQLILTRQAHIDYDDLPDGYENEAADFINKLIQRKPKNRLGKNSIKEVINHPWLKGYDWENLKNKKLKAYYIPKEGDNYDKKYCLQSNKIGTDTIERYKQITNEPNYDIIFKNFDCDKIPDELKIYIGKNKKGEIANNGNNSSNNSTTSISRNNKNNLNNNINEDNKKNKNNNLSLGKQRNKSMENIFADQNIIPSNKNYKNENDNKVLSKKLSAINILAKNAINDEDLNKEKNDENKNIENIFQNEDNKNEKENQKKEYKIIFEKKNDNNIMNKFSFRKKYNNENKEIKKLKDNYNNNINNNQNFSPDNSNNKKEKSSINEDIGDINNIKKIQNNELNIEKDKEAKILLNNKQKINNLNQYISNKYNHITKNGKLLSYSNSSINILSNELFANIKGNYFKKIINKNNNSLIASSSSKSLFKNSSNINENYLTKSKKHFLKKELFNGTFYPNKSTSTKLFVMNSNSRIRKRKASASLINKNMDSSKKKLASSSSMINLKQNSRFEINENNNISEIFANIDIGNNNSNAGKIIIKNIDKKLPFINMTMNKKTGGNFRNNLHLVNRNNHKNYLNTNGFFSERLKNNENKKLKNSINGNTFNKK